MKTKEERQMYSFESIENESIIKKISNFLFRKNKTGTEEQKNNRPIPEEKENNDEKNSGNKILDSEFCFEESEQSKIYMGIVKSLYETNRLISDIAMNNNDEEKIDKITNLYSNIQDTIADYTNANVNKMFKNTIDAFKSIKTLEKLINEGEDNPDLLDLFKKLKRLRDGFGKYLDSIGYKIIEPEIGKKFNPNYMISNNEEEGIVSEVEQLGLAHQKKDGYHVETPAIVRTEPAVVDNLIKDNN